MFVRYQKSPQAVWLQLANGPSQNFKVKKQQQYLTDDIRLLFALILC